MEQRDFKGIWIPKEIWFCEELNPTEMFILAEIDSLDRGEGERCCASNEHLAKRAHCSERTASRAITKLMSLGFIQEAGTNGRTRLLKSNLSPDICPGRVDNLSMQNGQNVQADTTDCQSLPLKEKYIEKNNKDVYASSATNVADEAPAPDPQTERFEKFWKAYPKKAGKQKARSAWKRCKVTAALFEQIMHALAAAKQTDQWQRNNGQYIPYPATWLNQGRWEDDVGTYDRASGDGSKYDDVARMLAGG